MDSPNSAKSCLTCRIHLQRGWHGPGTHCAPSLPRFLWDSSFGKVWVDQVFSRTQSTSTEKWGTSRSYVCRTGRRLNFQRHILVAYILTEEKSFLPCCSPLPSFRPRIPFFSFSLKKENSRSVRYRWKANMKWKRIKEICSLIPSRPRRWDQLTLKQPRRKC